VAVFDGVAVVLQTGDGEKTIPNFAVVCEQNNS
jgi:hypothetical protein